MSWYKTGTVNVTNNSNAVIGTGTAFISNSRVGDAFRGPDGNWYEVINIASDTAMSILPVYQGSSDGSGLYAIAPMQGYVKDSADALRAASLVIGNASADLSTQVNEAKAAAVSATTSANSASSSEANSQTYSNQARDYASSASTSATSAQESAQSAEEHDVSVTAKVARFLLPATTLPTQRDDGGSLQFGDRVILTTNGFEYVYKSGGWVVNNSDGQDLASSAGASKVGALIDGVFGTVQKSIDDFVAFMKGLTNTSDPTKGAANIGRGLQVVGSVAEIRTLSKSAVSKSAFATGYYAAGDGGGGSYTLDGSDTTTADDGGSVLVASDGGRWKLQFTQRTLDLKQFGARYGEDSTPKIQAAIAAMWKKYGGGVVGFSGALQTYGQVLLYPNVVLKGAGLDNSSIDTYLRNSPAFLTYRPAGYVPSSCIGAGLEEFGMANRVPDGVGMGLDLNNARNCTVHKVSFALYAQGLTFNRTVSAVGTINSVGEAYFNKVSQCDFISCERARVYYGAANRNTFDTNTIRNCLGGEDFASFYNTAETNTFINENWEGCQYPFLHKENEEFIYSQTFIGCTVENPTSNSFRCIFGDVGHQTFINMSVIGAVDVTHPFPDKRSNWVGRGNSDRTASVNNILSEPLELRGGIGFSGNKLRAVTTLNASFTNTTAQVVTIPVTGAVAGDFAVISVEGGTGDKTMLYFSTPIVENGLVRTVVRSTGTTTINGVDISVQVIKHIL